MSDLYSAQPLHVTSLDDHRFIVDDGRQRRLAYAISVEGATWVFLDGRVYVVRPEAGATEGGQRDDEAALAAPMPATVVSVEVSAGQQVTRGDVLVRLEAMKMELSIKAPRDATVATVMCRPGEFVQPGKRLVELA